MAHDLKTHYSRLRRGWHSPNCNLPNNQDDIEGKFKRGNLILNTGKDNPKYSWQFYHSKYFLILGKVINTVTYEDFDLYLVKTSATTRPTLKSKGHLITTISIPTTDEICKLSIAEAFKDL